MNFIIADVLNAIEKERQSLSSWAEDKRQTLADLDKLQALRWLSLIWTLKTSGLRPKRWACRFRCDLSTHSRVTWTALQNLMSTLLKFHGHLSSTWMAANDP